MKQLFVLSITLFSLVTHSQIGINTSDPKVTLDVTGKPSNPSEMDGILAPRLSGNELNAKSYTANQTGALVYVTTSRTAIDNGQTANVTSNGYFTFDGSNWQKVGKNSDNIYGDIKTGLQSGDHNGWIRLDGRSLSTLNSNQQTQATLLGLNTNLPDASNSFLVQDNSNLGNITSSNTRTIAQNQLPNVTLSGTTNTSGNHNHTFDRRIRYDSEGATADALGSPVGANEDFDGSGTTSSDGSHNHSFTTSSLNGNVPQQILDITPKSLNVNFFIFLGE